MLNKIDVTLAIDKSTDNEIKSAAKQQPCRLTIKLYSFSEIRQLNTGEGGKCAYVAQKMH